MTPRHQVSRTAIELIKRFEGYRRKAAQLPDGRWTIGYGHTLTAREGAEVSEANAEARVNKACQRAAEAIAKHLCHWQARRFETPEAAHAALATLEQAWQYHQVATASLIEHKHSACKGREYSEIDPHPMIRKAWGVRSSAGERHHALSCA